VFSYIEGEIVALNGAPIGDAYEHDVVTRFTFKPRLGALGRCAPTVADTLQNWLDSQCRVRNRQLATNGDCHGLYLDWAETELMRPFTLANRCGMKIGIDRG